MKLPYFIFAVFQFLCQLPTFFICSQKFSIAVCTKHAHRPNSSDLNTVYSPNDISGLRRPKNVKFGTKVASSTRMMHALRFLEKRFLIVAKFAHKNSKNEHIILHMLPQKPKTVEMQKLAQT